MGAWVEVREPFGCANLNFWYSSLNYIQVDLGEGMQAWQAEDCVLA